MKKISWSICFALFGVSVLVAQDINDALRYSQRNLTGTARYRGMSGAMTAVGGDMSSITLNPAGSVIFDNNFFTTTASLYDVDNDATYFGTPTSRGDTDVELNQAGIVWVFKEVSGTSNFNKIALGFNYDVERNLDNRFFFAGISNQSIGDYFLNFAQGIPLEFLALQPGETISDLYQFLGQEPGLGFPAQQAFLGFQGFIIDPVDNTGNNTQYISNIAPGTFNQNYFFSSRGRNAVINFNVASQFQNWLSLGLNLNAHTIDYRHTTLITENNTNAGSLVRSVSFENGLDVEGTGFSFQLGAIADINKYIKAGLSYQSPTWYRIREATVQSLRTRLDDNSTNFINPQIINVFPSYRLRTPGQWNAGLSGKIKKFALISVDYTYRDFSNNKLRPGSDPFFAQVNSDIETRLTDTSSFRVGGEYYLKNFTFRGGYRFEESPFNDGSTIDDLTGFSLGLGYKFVQGFSIDFAYDYAQFDSNQTLLNTGFAQTAQVETTQNSFVLGLNFNF